MKTRPIIFSGPMVRAVLEGRKTMTRRVIKPSWSRCLDLDDAEDRAKAVAQCPYGVPGDRLWVREMWFRPTTFTHPAGNWKRGGRMLVGYPDAPESRWVDCDRELKDRVTRMRPGKHPSIHMPRWASRITLEVTGVRAEMVQDIKCHDIRKEGFDCPVHDFPGGFCCSECVALRNEFLSTWNNLNAKSGFGWDSNPWVWCVAFRRVADA